VLEAYDFSGARTLLDVGGGHGGLLAQILERVPALQGILLDRPEVIREARAVLAPLGSRARLVAGNFLEAVPEGADTILLKHIIHDWDDAHCAALLANCRRSLARGARLLVVESILSDEPDAAFAKFLDLEMLVVTPGGRERTASEFSQLLAGAGFELARVVPTQSPVSILEAVAG
jgi:ubiquinone/menaquinone biosynthesis C-methylase UbiE